MAVAFEGGVVIGADSRTTMGSYIANRVTDKLTYLHDRIYCCRSGSAADTQAVADVTHAQLQQYHMVHQAPPTVHVAATMLEGLCYSNKDRLSAGIIVAGWDPVSGGTVYNIPLGGGLFKGPWAIGGSGSTYIYGYCDATFREGWNKEETVEFVRNGELSSHVDATCIPQAQSTPFSFQLSRWPCLEMEVQEARSGSRSSQREE